MNLTGIDQVAEAVGGRLVGPDGLAALAGQVVGRVTTDSRAVAAGDLFVALKGDRFDGHAFVAAAVSAGAVAAIVSQPIELPPLARPVGLILVRDTLAALGRLATWYRSKLPATVIAVTGSNGKTTTKSMIEHMLGKDRRVAASPKSFNNSIGVPLTLLSADASHDVVVCEIGSNAPGEIAALGAIVRPDIAVIVSISETHLERLRSLEGVATEKASLLGQLAPGGIGIVNGDKPLLLAAAKNYPCNLVRFGNDPQADMVLGELVTTADGLRFTINSADRVKLPLLGAHNAMNGLAAITVGRRLGLSVAEAAARLADFAPPPMRLQRMRVGGIDVINDAYNANPASMAAALEVFSDIPCRKGGRGGGRKVFLCGDMLELGPNSEAFHYQLGQRIAGTGVSRLIAVGKFSEAVVSGACQAGLAASATARFAKTEDLVEKMDEVLRPGDLVLLKGSRGVALERVLEALQRKVVEKG